MATVPYKLQLQWQFQHENSMGKLLPSPCWWSSCWDVSHVISSAEGFYVKALLFKTRTLITCLSCIGVITFWSHVLWGLSSLSEATLAGDRSNFLEFNSRFAGLTDQDQEEVDIVRGTPAQGPAKPFAKSCLRGRANGSLKMLLCYLHSSCCAGPENS